jgi:hypothetical protein
MPDYNINILLWCESFLEEDCIRLLEHYFVPCLLQVSPTECFLRYLQLPENDSVAVDLKQAAVVIMSHLDRLAAPHAPPATFTKVSYSS